MREIALVVAGATIRCSIQADGDQYIVRIGETTHHLRVCGVEAGLVRFFAAGRSRIVRVAREHPRTFLHVDGHTLDYIVATDADHAAARRPAAKNALTAPMPGAVTQVLIEEGDEVALGQALVIIEAMKMEHIIRAPQAGRVRAVRARPGDQVDGGAVLVEIAENPDGPAR